MRIAREAFLEAGYAGTAMSTVAARLGGSKGTLYNDFPSKEKLFAACGLESCSCAPLEATSDAPIPGETEERRLQRIGERLLLRSAERSMDYFRVIVAEAKRASQLAEVFYRAALAADLERLTDAFEDAAHGGRLVISDARRAAEQFVGLCLADLPVKLALTVVQAPASDQLRRQVREAVKIIMNTYASAGARERA